MIAFCFSCCLSRGRVVSGAAPRSGLITPVSAAGCPPFLRLQVLLLAAWARDPPRTGRTACPCLHRRCCPGPMRRTRGSSVSTSLTRACALHQEGTSRPRRGSGSFQRSHGDMLGAVQQAALPACHIQRLTAMRVSWAQISGWMGPCFDLGNRFDGASAWFGRGGHTHTHAGCAEGSVIQRQGVRRPACVQQCRARDWGLRGKKLKKKI